MVRWVDGWVGRWIDMCNVHTFNLSIGEAEAGKFKASLAYIVSSKPGRAI